MPTSDPRIEQAGSGYYEGGDPYLPQPDTERETSAATDRLTAGLDALESPQRGRRRIDPSTVIAPIIAVLVILLVWQVLVWMHVKPPSQLPSPATVWSRMADGLGWSTAAGAAWTSLARGLVGFVVSVVLGTVIGLAVGRISLLRKAIRPILAGLQSLPSVAWVPAGVLWFGTSNATMYAVVLLGAVPSIAMGMITGLDHVPPVFGQVGTVLGATRTEMVRFILLPAALPTFFAGVKQGWAFAWRALMAAELIVAGTSLGLGQLLNAGRTEQDMALVFGSTLLVLAVGVIVELGLFGPVERYILSRRGITPAASR